MKNSTRRGILFAFTAGVLLTACSKDNTPPADLTPYYELDNRVIYPTGGASVATFNPSSIQGTAVLTPQALVLDLGVSATKLHMEVDRAQLKLRDSPLRGADWVGSYAWRSFDRPTDPVFVHYTFRFDGATSVYPLSETTPQLRGSLDITAFDAKRHLISGRYSVEAPNQLTPLAGSMFPLITLRVSGKFDNLKVQM
ncbi:hypothetical protein MUN81_00375 [Hymenobacter sp. 5317J-9]|uniref:hypothetical protein n=1 Tax=Hymenobacter sp. 5317J-9 TaxID=2932250 RepID=UPI001FD66065|nr:hypothetical protein [Hymenobacter sp. 5317J-9]UOQ97969.1 hypothetical protein MUN81_00375 [Hymenobacter sp. 5317J-9]